MQYLNINNCEYKVIKLLGKGKSGYSYLVERENKQYVIKQIHHEPCDYYQFGNKLDSELHAYKKLKHLNIPLPELLEVDRANERILKTYIEGNTVYDLVLNDIPVENCLIKLKEILPILYSNNINIDYFPTNFILYNEVLFYVDYEYNNYMDEWNFENWGIKYWSKTKEFIEHHNKNNRK